MQKNIFNKINSIITNNYYFIEKKASNELNKYLTINVTFILIC